MNNKNVSNKININRRSLSSLIVREIVKKIQKGIIKPGEKFPPISIFSKEMNVGQSTLREAFKQLELIGMINIIHGKGVFVKNMNSPSALSPFSYIVSFSKTEIIQTIEVRKIIEKAAISLAIKRATPDRLNLIKDALEKMKDCGKDYEYFMKCDMEFHINIIEASENKILLTLFTSIKNIFFQEQRYLLKITSAKERAIYYHNKIYEAIVLGDEIKAIEALNKHLDSTEKYLLKMAKEYKDLVVNF